MKVELVLSTIPSGLRKPLLEEYNSIIQNFTEHRWSPSELSGGKFCEVVYTILDGFHKNSYAAKPSKPRDMVGACRSLEQHKHVPRSFQILVPRMLPALYEVRNNRGVGHVGGDVDPNAMDAALVVSMCNWILAELIRVFHNTNIETAQELVEHITERRIPLIWSNSSVKRILDPTLSLRDQILLLTGSAAESVTIDQLRQWIEYSNQSYFKKLLKKMHSERLVEFSEKDGQVELLPPGIKIVAKIIDKLNRN